MLLVVLVGVRVTNIRLVLLVVLVGVRAANVGGGVGGAVKQGLQDAVVQRVLGVKVVLRL